MKKKILVILAIAAVAAVAFRKQLAEAVTALECRYFMRDETPDLEPDTAEIFVGRSEVKDQ